MLASRCTSTIRPSLIMSFSSGNRHQRCNKHSFALRTIATATASCCCKCKPICQFLNAIVMISLSPVTLTGISMRLACLYTTARLFINCPNETKWEISSEVRKVFFDPCSLLHSAGSRLDLWPIPLHRATTAGCGDIKRCSPANSDADLQRRWRADCSIR